MCHSSVEAWKAPRIGSDADKEEEEVEEEEEEEEDDGNGGSLKDDDGNDEDDVVVVVGTAVDVGDEVAAASDGCVRGWGCFSSMRGIKA